MGQTTSNIMRKMVSPFVGDKKADLDNHGDHLKTAVTPFVFKRKGSLYRDEDGHTAHEFYEEVEDKQSKKRIMQRKYVNLTPEGEVELSIPRLHSDFPIVLCEAFPR
ncbi:hypothetical protein LSH36_178g06083 [Paralvinella palmiformis]|uniref:Tumor suppressor candidate 2 n=1 Tax=Paralvinella palmiformis TaxID=53620 RepID=A0AAD9N7P0_9ANNE|nr:hypothetical protein LSH36_178g06083 [Paralvinella palmiformis]